MEVFESHRSLIYAVAGVLGFCLVMLMSRGHGYWNKTLYGLDFSVPAWFYAAALLIAVTGGDPEEAWACGLWDVLAPLPLDRFLPLPRDPSQRTLGACFHRSPTLEGCRGDCGCKRFLALVREALGSPRARIRLPESLLPVGQTSPPTIGLNKPIAPRTGIGDEKAMSRQLCDVIYTRARYSSSRVSKLTENGVVERSTVSRNPFRSKISRHLLVSHISW